ncbi:MAG TPA: hypothetical protein VE571_02375 [Solirubrobacteraceae bacterium]|nr:hypothetical protein [Solirubrobacteraceae bacterium]
MDGGLTPTPTVELLWWEGCPSTQRALSELRDALIDVGLHSEVRMREIRTDEEAEAAQFTGSPTILIDGVELMAALGRGGEEEPAALNCRVYVRRDGRISPTPDPLDLRDALRAAAGTDTTSERSER